MQAGSMQGGIRAQAGSVGVMFAASLLVIIAVFGLALDLSRLYHRKGDMQNVAAAAALAAARELNGTTEGVTSAATKAATAANVLMYAYGSSKVVWDDAALAFGDAPDATNWVDLTAAKALPTAWRYVKVDTSKLDPDFGVVKMYFIQVVVPALTSKTVTTRAIAGRSGANVLPLGLCAMSSSPAESRTWAGPPELKELVEYGFRRGVSYDLMQLNPAGVTGRHFLLDPFAVPGGATATHTPLTAIGPFICTGTVALTRVVGAQVYALGDFPLPSFYSQLNSRFDTFTAKSTGTWCSPDNAPPDKNIKPYLYTAIPWMTTTRDGQGARSVADTSRLQTVADLVPPASAGTTAGMYGPLWSFARAVPFSSYVPNVAEPAGGYVSFAPDAWASLYKPGQPMAGTYPATTPYITVSGDYYKGPTSARKGARNRRVLNIPLLACPAAFVAPGATQVLAIGKFLMTVPATDTTLFAEFGGVVSEQAIGGSVELFQ